MQSIIVVALLGGAAPASALPPLADFLAASHHASIDDREAEIAAELQESDALIALSRSLPSASVRGQYIRNQYEVAFTIPANLLPPGISLPSGPIQPLDQLDAFFQLDVPIVDVANWARAYIARKGARAARISVEATRLEIDKAVARDYYQLLGAEALRQSATRALAAAESNRALIADRRAGGVATELDVSRAAAEVERARQAVTDAELLINLTKRALLTETGIAADDLAPPLVDDLREEPPLEAWEKIPDDDIPALAAAAEQARAAAFGDRAAKLSLLPTLTFTGLEHVTNATGFLLGHNSAYALTLTLAWRLDLSTVESIKSAKLQAELARIRQERAQLRVRDQINDAWQRVRAGIAKSRAARAQSEAAALAAQFADERYQSGSGTQLDVVQAQRDAYAAEVARIQADADLRFARALLRLDAGRPIDESDKVPR